MRPHSYNDGHTPYQVQMSFCDGVGAVSGIGLLVLQDNPAIFKLQTFRHDTTSALYLYAETKVICKGKVHKHRVTENL